MRKKPSRRRLRRPLFENLESRRLLAQLVTPAAATQTVELNQDFTVATNYSTDPAEQTTGVAVRLYFDPNFVDFDISNATIPENVPFSVVDPRLRDDDGNADGDINTTQFIQVQFQDAQPPPDFPAELTPLFEAVFTAKELGTTNLNYTFPFNDIAPTSTTINIIAPLPRVSVGVNPDSVVEDAGNDLVYTFTRTGDTTEALTVNYTTSGDATAGTDYSGTSSSVVIDAGEMEATVNVTPTADTDDENDESVILTISPNSGVYNVATATATATITDDDEPPLPNVSLSVGQQSVLENAGTVTVTLNLSAASDAAVSVPFTVTGTADSGDDFTISASPVTFAAGVTSADVTINVVDDAPVEPDETVILTLGTPTGATLGDTTAQTVTIRNNDVETVDPTVSLSDSAQSVLENVGTVTVTLNLSAASDSAVSVPFTVTGTATSGDDFSISASPVTFAAGVTTADVTINVVDDAGVESDETVVVTLGTPTGATLGATTAQTVTIRNNDVVTVDPTVSLSDSAQTVLENAGAVTVTLNLSAASDSAVSVPFTVTGTAADGSDFTITASPVTFAAGATTADVTINVTDDAEIEPDETVIVTLGTPTGATLGATTAQTVTIRNNDVVTPDPTVAFTTSTQTVGEGVGTTTITVALTAASDSVVTVPFAVSGRATDGNDFTITASPITIAPGDTTATISVGIINDNTEEGDESIIVTLGTPTGADLGTSGVHTVTIPANDGVIDGDSRIIIPRVSVGRFHVIPGDGIPTAVLFRATTDTAVQVTRILAASPLDQVTILKEDLSPVANRGQGGGFVADLQADNLYAMIFHARDNEAMYSVRASAGNDVLSGSSSTNLLNRADVNADGESTANDALMIINALTRGNTAEGEEGSDVLETGYYYDVNGDGRVTPVDALGVINQLERGGEGEQGMSALAAHLGSQAFADQADHQDADHQDADPGIAHSAHDVAVESFGAVASDAAGPIHVVNLVTNEVSDVELDELLGREEVLDDVLSVLF